MRRSQKIKVKNLLLHPRAQLVNNFQKRKYQSVLKLIQNIKYVQNRYVWMKAAMGILTIDTRPKLSMEECAMEPQLRFME